MSEILILARVRLRASELPLITDYYFKVGEHLSKVEGFNGVSVWRDPREPESFLVIYEYADRLAADRGFVAVSEVRVLAETQGADFRPADVILCRVVKHSASRPSQTPLSACLSMSVRIADPGYGPELQDELERIFSELHYLPGFIAWIYGTNDSLEEEAIGLATWQSRAAFLASLPRAPGQRKIEMYERFF